MCALWILSNPVKLNSSQNIHRAIRATKNHILEQLKILEALYNRGEVSEVLELSLPKIIAHEIAIAKQQAAELETDLQQFETKYQMPSPEFYQKILAGELGDDRFCRVKFFLSNVMFCWRRLANSAF